MFAGLATLVIDEEQTILGMSSREGETVMFKRVISIKDHPKINEWLTKVITMYFLVGLYSASLKFYCRTGGE